MWFSELGWTSLSGLSNFGLAATIPSGIDKLPQTVFEAVATVYESLPARIYSIQIAGNAITLSLAPRTPRMTLLRFLY